MARSPKKRRSDVDVHFTLKRVFRKAGFRPLQLEVIQAAIAGHDIFLCAATSFGKSLCYQLPAVVATGVTMVVSPLLALMNNQVLAAKGLGIACEMITGSTTLQERRKIETDLLCGHPETRLLYVTPELCQTDRFRKILQQIHRQGQLTRVAIDEAHCISEWGHDFRKAYKDLVWMKQNLILPSVPIMAVTATATKQVRDDIYTFLGLKTAMSFSTSSARPNIHYEVQYFSESNPHSTEGDLYPILLNWLTRLHHRRYLGSLHAPDPTPFLNPIHGIIYCSTRNSADDLAARLTAHSIRASSYHAGLDTLTRGQAQASFLASPPIPAEETASIAHSFNLVCATTAFGMGIDMPNIRFVVHYGLPRGMESFTQESGRAGRDNKAASSVILYTREDKDRALWRLNQDAMRERKSHAGNGQGNADGEVSRSMAAKQLSLQKMIEYCENAGRCRHELVGEYFGNDFGNSVCVDAESHQTPKALGLSCDYACDVCKEGQAVLQKRKDKGLATAEESMEYTQRQRMMGTYDDYVEYGNGKE
ncbi:ATP-dependent DNA helicase Q-like 3 [Cyphellophora attinorum]|uniref:ATP-dependent DNA helicase n=1 Tax=Cyphellophora attinorum TaxID=1664694 RepID=A0A0N1P131_9EURO|nr:ATP-dependent DNA helicase Q-like 3 [Phialophora attinorum]KPI41507.1 ATP-dependent DNA helicase Q-like 3 [Phialophora attinorum]